MSTFTARIQLNSIIRECDANAHIGVHIHIFCVQCYIISYSHIDLRVVSISLYVIAIWLMSNSRQHGRTSGAQNRSPNIQTVRLVVR